MTFTSFEFVVFVALVLLGRRLISGVRSEQWLLLAASCAFYMSWSIPGVVLLLFMSLTDYTVARKLGVTVDGDARKRLLWVSLAVNLGALGFFKYSNFFLQNLTGALDVLGWHVGAIHFNVLLPPAISYFTFAGLSYVLDVYYERIRPCTSAREYTLFVTFFPKLLSGPIARAKELLPQLHERVRATWADVEIGLAYFLVGAIKKLVIADQLAAHVDVIFATPGRYDAVTLLQGVVGYAIQLYCDFSGYSDMAIGCARILGYRFPQNFQMPFSAASITDFWRRWHITLSTWFRDYAFLPLEIATRGNPNPTVRVSINLLVMMLLVGLWHGPSWNFVLFGAIHGLALVLHKMWTTWGAVASIRRSTTLQFVWACCARGLTLAVVLVAFVFFRTESLTDAGTYLSGIASWHAGIRVLSPYIVGAFALMLLVHLAVGADRNLVEELSEIALPVRIAAYTSLMMLLVTLGAGDATPFIYVQF